MGLILHEYYWLDQWGSCLHDSRQRLDCLFLIPWFTSLQLFHAECLLEDCGFCKRKNPKNYCSYNSLNPAVFQAQTSKHAAHFLQKLQTLLSITMAGRQRRAWDLGRPQAPVPASFWANIGLLEAHWSNRWHGKNILKRCWRITWNETEILPHCSLAF